ncbi:MAG: C13 family peptidase, partial [Hyphomonadaceae bacterium]
MKRTLVAAAACLLPLAAGASAQQMPQADPFRGQAGMMEIALPPRVAARQAELLAAALGGLQAQRPGRTDVYVLAASFWSDPVFEREATQAAQILSRRLHAEGRTIVLSAGTGSGERAYAATTPNNVNAALGRIGALIDPNEDLVVLFFTSHGAPDGSIAIREHNRMGGVLRPVNLRDALTDAGIRSRVVIVSACYSGAFIAPLMNEDTIILTAAAPDRTSFGCQPTREWTYFGDAYFGQALAGGAGIVQGFEQAQQTIAQWEREQNLHPSNPQRSGGARAAA